MKSVKRTMFGFGLGLAVAMGATQNASAVDVPFDPDGPGPIVAVNGGTPLSQVLLTGLDWSEGNAVAVGAIIPDANPVNQGTLNPGIFDVYYQAKLSKFGGITIAPHPAPGTTFDETNFEDAGATDYTVSGLNPDFEWTVVAHFKERVIGFDAGTNTTFFQLVNDPSNYLKIFYDATPDANNALGTGFVGTLAEEILSASIVVEDNSAFQNNGNSGDIDNGNPQQSVYGSGSLNVTAIVDSWNDAFLNLTSIGILPGELRSTLITSTLELPFGPSDPAAGFVDANSLAFVVPSIGLVNGFSGPDFVFEADSNQVFDKVLDIPEPATAMLGLMGLAGMAMRRRRTA